MTPVELKEWRHRNGYSQGLLCRTLGVDVMTVSRWERGVSQIPAFLKLALERLECDKKEEKEGPARGPKKEKRR